MIFEVVVTEGIGFRGFLRECLTRDGVTASFSNGMLLDSWCHDGTIGMTGLTAIIALGGDQVDAGLHCVE